MVTRVLAETVPLSPGTLPKSVLYSTCQFVVILFGDYVVKYANIHKGKPLSLIILKTGSV